MPRRQARFVLSDPCGQHPKSLFARLLHRGQPQGGLADAGFALDDQSGRLNTCRLQELGKRGKLDRTADHIGRQMASIASSEPIRL